MTTSIAKEFELQLFGLHEGSTTQRVYSQLMRESATACIYDEFNSLTAYEYADGSMLGATTRMEIKPAGDVSESVILAAFVASLTEAASGGSDTSDAVVEYAQDLLHAIELLGYHRLSTNAGK